MRVFPSPPRILQKRLSHDGFPTMYAHALKQTRAYSCVIVRTRAYSCVVGGTRAYSSVLGRTRAYSAYSGVLGRTRAYSCVLVRTRAYSRVLVRTRAYSCVLVRTRAYSCVLGRTRAYSRVLVRTRAYSGVLGRTRAYSGVLVHTRAYSCVLGRTRAYSGVLVRTRAYSCVLRRGRPSLPQRNLCWPGPETCVQVCLYMCKCVLQDLPDGTHINKENLQATLLEAGHTCCAESGTLFPRLGTLYTSEPFCRPAVQPSGRGDVWLEWPVEGPWPLRPAARGLGSRL